MPRKITVATTGFGLRYGATVEDNLTRAYDLLDAAGAHEPDVACLPEVFPHMGFPMARASESAQTVSGPVFAALAERARRRMYVVAGVFEERGGRLYNTTWVIDRQGALAGRYDKIHPTIKEIDAGVVPGQCAGIVETDFGRIGIATCYDIGWPAEWDELGRQGAELVFWPSAYDGGFPLQTYAWRNGYYVVSAVWSHHARLLDPTGRILASTNRLSNLLVEHIDLDTLVMHADDNEAKLERMMTDLGRRITITTLPEERVITLQSNDPDLTTADIAREYGLESFVAYHARAQCRQDEGRQRAPTAASAR